MADKSISVIIPVHNGSRTIGLCLESLFRSSYPEFECIVVDDHSTDNTVSLAQPFDTRLIRLEENRGASYARNQGVEMAQGDILLFIDADVTVYPDCLERVAGAFEKNPEVSAFFGSYDDQPGCANFLSQYKNLFHHFIHQTSCEDASTFWTACGAVRKGAFFDVGKFDEKCRMMEDIELGYRLKGNNHKIRLVKDLQVKHFKRYSFASLLKSDLFDRAIPWTILMLSNKQATSDLNLKLQHKLSAVVLMLMIVFSLSALTSIWFAAAIPFLFAVFFLLNSDFYRFYLKKKGALFALKVVPLHLLYYLYSSLGYVIGTYQYYTQKKVS